MELSKKTTILFPPEQYAQLARLASQEKTSVGELVRKACERQYGLLSAGARLEAVRQLASLQLPAGTPGEMEQESVPQVEEVL